MHSSRCTYGDAQSGIKWTRYCCGFLYATLYLKSLIGNFYTEKCNRRVQHLHAQKIETAVDCCGVVHKIRNAHFKHFQYPPPPCNAHTYIYVTQRNAASDLLSRPLALRNLWMTPVCYAVQKLPSTYLFFE